MKTPREIIASIVYKPITLDTARIGEPFADAAIAALTASGYRIVPAGREQETIEACAKVVEGHQGVNYKNLKGYISWRLPTQSDLAAAIRTMGGGE